MCDKACCTNTTRHAIILLSILSLLLLINAPSLHLRPTSTTSKEVAGPNGGGGGGDAPPCLPCATCTHNMFTSFLYGVLFTSIFVMTIIATNHIPTHTSTHHTASPLPWGGPATWSVLMEADYSSSRDDGSSSSGSGGGGGVGDALMRTFPTFAYSSRWKSKMGKGESKCVICQTKFREGEMLRLLPQCDHVFHLSCIDKWLASHESCPCCRAQLQILSNDIYDEDFEFPF